MPRLKSKKTDALISGPTEEVKKEKTKYSEQDFTDLALLTESTVYELKEEFFLYYTRKFMSKVVKVVTRYAVSDIELEMLVNALQDANIKGKNVFAYCGNGNCTEDVKLYSANATIEGAYKKVYGCTKSEFIKGVKQRMASLKHSYKNNVQEMGK